MDIYLHARPIFHKPPKMLRLEWMSEDFAIEGLEYLSINGPANSTANFDEQTKFSKAVLDEAVGVRLRLL